MFNFFKTKQSPEQSESKSSTNLAKNSADLGNKTWYEERCDSIIIQRNWLIFLMAFALVFSLASLFVVKYVLDAKDFRPFVIQIDNSTGYAKVVNAASDNILAANESLAKYFVKKYINARETYNPVDFDVSSRKIVRLLSNNSSYRDFIGYIRNENTDPRLKYGDRNSTFLVVKSFSRHANEQDIFFVRFSINEISGAQKTYHKIATVRFRYLTMELSEEDRDINPVGFQVVGYRVDDDSS